MTKSRRASWEVGTDASKNQLRTGPAGAVRSAQAERLVDAGLVASQVDRVAVGEGVDRRLHDRAALAEHRVRPRLLVDPHRVVAHADRGYALVAAERHGPLHVVG